MCICQTFGVGLRKLFDIVCTVQCSSQVKLYFYILLKDLVSSGFIIILCLIIFSTNKINSG